MSWKELRDRQNMEWEQRRKVFYELARECPKLYWNVIEYLDKPQEEHSEECRWDVCNIGLRCDVGWLNIIRKASIMINALIESQIPEEHQRKYCAHQIKEKWWGLRFYIGKYFPSEDDPERHNIESINRAIGSIIHAAELEASFTCEKCGRFGVDAVESKGLCKQCYGIVHDTK